MISWCMPLRVAVLVLVLTMGPAWSTSAGQTDIVAGSWAYRSVAFADGIEHRTDGLFVFKDGRFVQHVIHEGEPLEQQMTMGHAGTYAIASDGSLQLSADYSIIVAPPRDALIRVRRDTRHHIVLERNDKLLTLRFDSGALHRLERVGEGLGVVHVLREGAIALVDDRFILVACQADRTTLAHGKQDDVRRAHTLHAAYLIDIIGTGRDYGRDVTVPMLFDSDKVILYGDHILHLLE